MITILTGFCFLFMRNAIENVKSFVAKTRVNKIIEHVTNTNLMKQQKLHAHLVGVV